MQQPVKTRPGGVIQSCPVLAKSFLAGSFSGTCSTILFQPLDLLKTRVQLASSGTGSTERSLIRIAAQVLRQEKVFGLWRGLVPSLYRTVPGIGVYFCSLHWISDRFRSREVPPALESLTFGACARSISGCVTLPFTVVKTRYESGMFNYRSVVQALTFIYHSEGYKGLFNGLFATLLRDVPFSGFYYMFYTQLKTIFTHGNSPSQRPHPVTYFASGVLAGCLASVVTHPADVVKTRLQLAPATTNNIRSAVRSILSDYGVGGFLRGLLPRLIRRTLMAAMSWTVYEQMMCSLELGGVGGHRRH